MSGSRRGFALLESLVALTIITMVGVNVVLLGQSTLRSEHQASAEELSVQDADRLLTAISLLRRGELDQRIGRHEVGQFTVDIQRPEPVLYRVAIVRTAAPARELLVTVLFRKPDSAS